jgi:hypothetical protein
MSIRGNCQLSIEETDADEVVEAPGRIDTRNKRIKRSREEEERSEIDGINWTNVELDGWASGAGHIQIRRSKGSVAGVEYGAGPPAASD